MGKGTRSRDHRRVKACFLLLMLSLPAHAAMDSSLSSSDREFLKMLVTDYYYHTIHKCYAEGVALGALNQILGRKGQ